MKTKSIFLSKTFWLNFIMFALSISELIDPTFCTIFGIANPVQFMGIMGIITAVLNKILRMTSTTAVTLTGEPKKE